MFWTNTSVLQLAGNSDPVEVIEQVARSTVFRFLESGGAGPPFNPFDLASFLGLNVIATNDVRDARTVVHGSKLLIEFNPNRPKARINYSISHEIAHTFFADCKEKVRNRALHKSEEGDEWQLETLCNIGAAELLIPAKDLPALVDPRITIEQLVDLRSKYEVSMETLLLRLVRTTKNPTYVFAASRVESQKPIYKIDYAIGSTDKLPRLKSGTHLPTTSVVADCTGIGYTARANETWKDSIGSFTMECVGIPPYPGQPFPRVVGFARTSKAFAFDLKNAVVVRGDATKPRGSGKKLIAFVVNDATPRWGAGFAIAVKRKWPMVQENFVRWCNRDPRNLELGKTHFFELDDELIFAEMICQRGYGPSTRPRLRYSSLEICLREVSAEALKHGASIHMPMIGSGQAGGNWSIVLELIDRILGRQEINVYIYELPGKRPVQNDQLNLLFPK